MTKSKTPMKGVFQKNGYWYARVDGREVYCGKGSKGRKLAEIARKKYEVKIFESREITAGVATKRIEFKNLEEMASWYMELPSVKQLAAYTRKKSLLTHLTGYFGNMQLTQIEGDHQERYREYRKLQGASEGTINMEIALLSTMFNTALKAKKITAEMMPGEFVKVKHHNPRIRVPVKDVEAIIDRAAGDFKDMLICAYETAMRLSEICNLTAGKVKLDIQHISGKKVDYIDLGIFDTKNKKWRVVPVSSKLKEVLERRLQGLDADDLVFTDRGRKYHAPRIGDHLKPVCKAAGVIYGDNVVNDRGEPIGITFHCFRHTRTSKWVEMGFSDEIIRRATGHLSLSAYQNYVKLDPVVIYGLVERETKTRQIATKIAVKPRQS